MRLVIDSASANVLVGAVKVYEHTLFEVGIQLNDPGVWPLTLNLVQINRHVQLTRKLALELAGVLIAAAESVDVQCRRCSEVEDAPIHTRSSRKWMHDYDEQAIGVSE